MHWLMYPLINRKVNYEYSPVILEIMKFLQMLVVV